MDSNPICHPSSVKKWNPHFLIMFNFWWSARLVNGLKPHLPPLSSQKIEMLIFGLHSLWMIGQAGQWTPTPSTTPLQPNTMKCSYFDYVQLLMISLAGQWTQNPSASPLQPIKWNTSFWIVLTSDDQPGWLMDSNPICHLSPAKNMKCSSLDYIQLLMIGRTGRWTQTHLPPLSSQKHEMLIFVLHLISDVGQTCQWTRTPSTIPLQPKIWNACFCITFNFWWLAGLVDGLKRHSPPIFSQ